MNSEIALLTIIEILNSSIMVTVYSSVTAILLCLCIILTWSCIRLRISKNEINRFNELREKALYRYKILTDVFTQSFQNRQEQLDYVLQEALKLTESQYGYVYLYDEEKRELFLNSWTQGVLEDCYVVDNQRVFQLEDTGIWGEVVRQRKPIIINDYEQPNPLKKGYPKGHIRLKRLLSIPIIIDENIVAVVGLANKQKDYDNHDVLEMNLLMGGTWNAVERRDAQERLSFERNKYLQILISICDGVMVVDTKGHVEMLNEAAEKLTGWSIKEAYGKHYRDVFILSREQDRAAIKDPIEEVFLTDAIQDMESHVLVNPNNNNKYYVENSAAPIKNDKNKTIGVVLVFRDVTEKKEQQKKIEYLSFRDPLTDLYNRRFFEEQLRQLDTEENLPFSIILCDVNGLKLTNDIFGHTLGDFLLKKVANVLTRVSRNGDIIARLGGDEFALLLPKTNLQQAEKVIEKINREFSKEDVKAVKCSISTGAYTKVHIYDNIDEVLDMAEERMYLSKTLERGEFKKNVIDNIIKTLHENSHREKDHSLRVSELCQEMGKILKLSVVDIRKLKELGYLHDIGKIVLDPRVLNKCYGLTPQEKNETKKHSIIGYRILNSSESTVDLAELVLAHHEQWDGGGYPKGLKGEEIPLLARIASIAETYDRMIHPAECKEALSKTDAVRVIRESAGIRFDPQLAEIFAGMIEKSGELL
jgi:diguanylate cyclase (GGDEF)-like protein/PAS domain S-box-containing protein/putative nucleotidyltransferase with HDIG domain